MPEPPILRLDLSLSLGDRLPLEQVYQERRELLDEQQWQGLIGVNVSPGGLEKSAEGAQKMGERKITPPQESTAEVVREKAGADLAQPAVRQGLDQVLRTLTGIGLDELNAAVEQGKLPEKLSLRLLDPVGNTVADVARKTALDSGQPPEVAEQVAGASGLLAGILFPPGGPGKASRAANESRLARIRAFLKGEVPGAERTAGKAAGAVEETVAGAGRAGGVPPETPGTAVGAGGMGAMGEARVNVARVDASEAVKRTMQRINAMQAERLAGSRQVVTHGQTIAESRGALSLEDALRLDPETTVLKAAEMTALRDHYNAASTLVTDLAKRTLAGDQQAAADLAGAFTVAGELAIRDEAIASNVARSLEARKILSAAERSPIGIGDLAEMAQKIGTAEVDPTILAQRLQGLTKRQLAVMARQTVSAARAGQNALYEAWINALLSGPQTHATNILSNTLTMLWAVNERFIAENLHRGADPGVMRGEAMALLRGMVDGYRDGIRLAGKALREGEAAAFGPEKVERVPAITSGALGADPEGVIGRSIDFLGNVVRIPTKALTAEDAFFKAVNYRMELRAQAYREAVLEGLNGKALAKRVAEIEANPSPAVKTAAEQFALVQTFNQELGPSGQALMRLAENTPGGRIVLPFIRTPANILRYVGERTPLVQMLSSQLRADLAAGGARRDLAVAKIASGAMTSAVVASLAGAGLITGGGPKDKNLQRELRNTGWQPYSIKVGDTWYSYTRLDPLGGMLGIVADATEIIGQLPEREVLEMTAAIGLAVSKHMVSKTYLEGLSNALEAIEYPDRAGRDVLESLARTVVPTGVAQVTRTLDPTLRETRDLVDQIRARIPGWSATLKPRRNLWADPIMLTGGLGPDLISPIYSSTAKDDPASQEIVRNRVSISMPSRYVAGPPDVRGLRLEPATRTPGIELTDEEYDRLVVIMGKDIRDGQGLTLHDSMNALVKSPEYQRQSDGPEGGKALLIRSTIQGFKASAQAQLFQERPDLRQLVEEHMTRQAEKKLPKTDPRSPQFLEGLGRSLAR